jgi:hypothetical protein
MNFENYNPNKKYVGANGKWHKAITPRKLFGIDFNYPAFQHDKSFHEGQSRLSSDLNFIWDSLHLVEQKDWKYLPNSFMRQLTRFTALIYFVFIRDFGKPFYEENKRKRK